MRHLFSLFTMFLCLQSWAQEHSALLMVHFGTTYDSTRTRTIDAINRQAQLAVPQLDFAEAYASRLVVKRLAERGVEKQLPLDALLTLRSQGYRRVVVQPTFVIDGKEMDMLRRDVERVRPFFDEVVVGKPLLYSVDDCEKLCRLLAGRHPAAPLAGAKGAQPRRAAKGGTHVVFIGHGTEGPATALYSQLDYIFSATGHPNHHVATIEGYPTLQTLTDRLRAARAKSVTLVPLLFVAGDHAANDIAVEWKEALQRQGFAVSVCLEGLGEVPQVQQLYIDKIGQ